VQRLHDSGAAAVGAPLTLSDKARLMFRLAKYTRAWGVIDLHLEAAATVTGTLRERVLRQPRFVTIAAAVAKIAAGSVVLSNGFGGTETCFAFYMALRRHADALGAGSDLQLDWVHCSGNGARGRAPGSVEELARPGLIRRFIAGHLETARRLLELGGAGGVELYNVPIGTLAALVRGQANGETALTSAVGVGTSIDPRAGDAGNNVTPGNGSAFIAVAGPDLLTYTIPPITVCVFHAVCCDADGNVYLHKNVTITESVDGAMACKRNGGIVMASVRYIVANDDSVPRELVVPAHLIDYISVCDAPSKSDPVGLNGAFLPGTASDVRRTYDSVRFINTAVGITPKRGAADTMLGRLAAREFVAFFSRGAVAKYEGLSLGTLGIGLPEEVGFNLYTNGITPQHITLCTESGAFGGIPAAGIFFGAAIKPLKVLSEAAMFDILGAHLHAVCLGALEVDLAGNVNVSRKGTGVLGAVGTGGFPNFVTCAKNIVFMFSWVTGGGVSVKNGGTEVAVQAPKAGKKGGRCKLVPVLSEVTFSAKAALARGARVLYCTHVGVFELRVAGIALVRVFPGVSVDRDVLAVSGLPVTVDPDLRVIGHDVVSGKGFTLLAPEAS
jgi:propionate CoA-transferase